MRVSRHDAHLPEVRRGARVEVLVDGRSVVAYLGETIATVLLAEGIRIFRRTANGHPRGIFCGMGICYDCLVSVNGTPNVRACVTPISPGMAIETGGRARQTRPEGKHD